MRKLLVVSLLCAAACSSGGTKRVKIDEDDEILGTGIESPDVEAMATFADGILALPELTGPQVEGTPTVAIHPVQNDTDQDFDGELFVRRIRAALIQKAEGRLKFVVRDRNEAVIERERIAKRGGEYTTSKQETKTGADFYLTGIAASISKVKGSYEGRAIWVDFQLIDSENGEILWEDTLKTKKVGDAGVIYR
jgi:PBP1b-binding outer membrane lipoprotein LpoB